MKIEGERKYSEEKGKVEMEGERGGKGTSNGKKGGEYG